MDERVSGWKDGLVCTHTPLSLYLLLYLHVLNTMNADTLPVLIQAYGFCSSFLFQCCNSLP